MRKLQPTLSKKYRVTIYQSFIGPRLDYGDVVSDQASNESCHQSLESLQYSAAIAITGTIRRVSSEKVFQESP